MEANHERDHDLIITVGVVLDRLESSECSQEVLGTTLAMILMKMGENRLESYTAGIQLSQYLREDFSRMYWMSHTFASKISTLMGAVATAQMLISDAKLDAKIREQAKHVLSIQDAENSRA